MGSSCACCKQLLSQLCVAIALAGVVLDIFTAMGRGRYRPCLDCPASNTSGLDWAFAPLALTLSQAFPWLSVSQCCDSAGHDYRYRKRRRGRTPRGFVRDQKFGVTGGFPKVRATRLERTLSCFRFLCSDVGLLAWREFSKHNN